MACSYLFHKMDNETNELDLFDKFKKLLEKTSQQKIHELSFRKKNFQEAQLDYLQIGHMKVIRSFTAEEALKFLRRIGRYENKQNCLLNVVTLSLIHI